MARVYASEPFTRRSLREGFVAGTCARNGFFLYSYNVRKYEEEEEEEEGKPPARRRRPRRAPPAPPSRRKRRRRAAAAAAARAGRGDHDGHHPGAQHPAARLARGGPEVISEVIFK
eukprot:30897-Pelagococcus_subviridis.AAC.28